MSDPKAEAEDQQSSMVEEDDLLIEMFGPLNKDNDTFHDSMYW